MADCQTSQAGFDIKSYTALIGLAEYFKSCDPSKTREYIHCLQASLNIGLPALLDAKVRLNLAKCLLQHTNNLGHARSHLQQALQVSQCLSGNDADEVFFDSASCLAKFCSEQNQSNFAKNILRSALERSSKSETVSWHYRLIFQLAELHAHDKEIPVAIELLSAIGELTAGQHGHHYVRLLFMLSKQMLLLAVRNFKAFEKGIEQTDAGVENFKENSPNQENRILVFWSLLKSYYFLLVGQSKSGKPTLKVLQQTVQELTSAPKEEHADNDPEALQWLENDQLCVLVYLVTVAHSMHSGCLDKAIKYTDKALAQIEAMRASGDSSRLITVFQLSLMEHAIMCKIITGKGSAAIQEIGKVCHICQQDSQAFMSFKPSFHTLLGLYGMSMNLMNESVQHFKKALEHSRPQSEVYNLAALNLAIIYARGGAKTETQLTRIFQNLNNDTVNRSQSLQAGYFYVKGLTSFFEANFHDAKKYLRETLRLGNAEDLNRITTCSLVLLGHVVTASGNPQEALNMVIPAMQLASKVSDVYLQLWSASLLKDIYHLIGDESRETEGAQLHHLYTTQLLQDHFQAGQRPEHALLKDNC